MTAPQNHLSRAPIAPPIDMPAPAARTVSISAEIGGRTVLHDISLDIPTGSFTALLGANGAGKSTLLYVLATLIPPTRGTLDLFGQSAGRATAGLRARLGLIGHQLMLYRELTALENLELFAKLYGVAEPRRRALDVLDFVGLRGRADSPVRTLSRGMAQRIAIARAILHAPSLLLADEPYTGLDGPSAAKVDSCFAELHSAGCAIVLTGHELAECRGLAQRVVVLREGGLALDAPASAIDEYAVKHALGGIP